MQQSLQTKTKFMEIDEIIRVLELQLGPQQLKNMTVLRDSSACFTLSSAFLAALEAVESKALENRRACLEEELQVESLSDLMAESHFADCSFIPCTSLMLPWYTTLLIYLKLIWLSADLVETVNKNLGENEWLRVDI